ncbi:MAG: hypothetical protein P1Q69_18110 [Candidatus Thorarchaeota archaeon]|nr:hypothetical protein [Candidatus Thorarchaeota archaeon]
MGLMRTAAVKGFIPPGNKVIELRDNLMRLMTTTATVMEERFGEEGLQAVAEVFRRLGTEDAEALRSRLDLGDTLKDALDAWLVIGHVMGSKIVTTWISENRVETDHPFCPQHKAFTSKGKLYCESVCWPYVEAVATGIAKGAKMEVPKPADDKTACTKAIVISPSE